MAGAVGYVDTNGFNSIKKADQQKLGRDEFLKLLVTQMQYQDPLEPVKNEAFVAQLAQFSTLESMEHVEDSFEGVQTYALIGKRILKEDSMTMERVEGVVAGVKYIDGKYTLILPNAVNNKVDKYEARAAFGSTAVDYDKVKDQLFTATSLHQDKLEWNPELSSLQDFASVLGYTAENIPNSLRMLWEKSYYIEIPVEDVSYVFDDVADNSTVAP